ncbi:SOS response-associated peptidase [Georgenia sp. Z1491]|uniref:SOS response-associated peptidase n=1 Tax=Georgenia sp. Z1491 TaxID=3416707 RepID=UPI003CF087A2
MCGRYASFRQAQDLADVFDVHAVADGVADLRPSWNVAPTQDVLIVVERLVDAEGRIVGREGSGEATGPRRSMEVARWGLVPHWAKDPTVGSKMINARSETVAEKASFKAPLRTNRCLVLADGYYEWRAPASGTGPKTPHFITRSDGAPIAFAGMFSWWRPKDEPDADWLCTTTILTAAAEGDMRELHDRVPVILEPSDIDLWLDPTVTDPAEALAILATGTPALTWYAVSRAVNTPRNNSAELVEPVA